MINKKIIRHHWTAERWVSESTVPIYTSDWSPQEAQTAWSRAVWSELTDSKNSPPLKPHTMSCTGPKWPPHVTSDCQPSFASINNRLVVFLHQRVIITDRISTGGNAIASIPFEPSDLWPWPFACVRVMTIAQWDQRSRSDAKVRVLIGNAVDGTSIVNLGKKIHMHT